MRVAEGVEADIMALKVASVVYRLLCIGKLDTMLHDRTPSVNYFVKCFSRSLELKS